MRRVALPRWRRWLVAGGCGLLSGLLIAVSYDSFSVLGGTAPAVIWGPTYSATWCSLMVGAVLLAVLMAPRRWIGGVLLLWLALLATLTHRISDRGPDGVDDQWFGLFNRHRAGNTDGAQLTACTIAYLPALCATTAGARFRTVTLVRFAPMREDFEGHLFPG